MIEFKKTRQEKNIFTFTAFENEKEKGFCRFSIDGYNTFLLQAESEDELIKEGLIRASLNFAANRGCYMARCEGSVCPNILKKMHFEGEKELSCDIPTALTGSLCG